MQGQKYIPETWISIAAKKHNTYTQSDRKAAKTPPSSLNNKGIFMTNS